MIFTKYIFIWNEDDVNCRKLKYKLKWKKIMIVAVVNGIYANAN